MPIYICSNCGRTVELPEGTYYCKECGPEYPLGIIMPKKLVKLEPATENVYQVYVYPEMREWTSQKTLDRAMAVLKKFGDVGKEYIVFKRLGMYRVAYEEV